MDNTVNTLNLTPWQDGYARLMVSPRFLSAADPQGIIVSGEINKGGKGSLLPLIHLAETTPDLTEAKGSYTIRLLDASG